MGAYILAALVCGLVTYTVANKKKLKYPILWGVAGAIFTIVAVGAVTFINKKVKNKK